MEIYSGDPTIKDRVENRPSTLNISVNSLDKHNIIYLS